MMSTRAMSKFLDILVLCQTEVSISITALKDKLKDCIHQDCYAIYGIIADKFTTLPWMSTCCTLVIPSPCKGGPTEITPLMLERVCQFCQNGGTMLSLHPHINAALCGPVPPEETAALTEISISSPSGQLVTAFTPFVCHLHTSKTSLVFQAADRYEGVSLVEDSHLIMGFDLKEKSDPNSPASAILSAVDLIPDISQFSEIDDLKKLKKTALERDMILKIILQKLGLQCRSSTTPHHSLSYAFDCPEISSTVGRFTKSSYRVELVERDDNGGLPVDCRPDKDKMCIVSDPRCGEMVGLSFDPFKYLELVKTKWLGRSVIYTEIIGSTQDLFTKDISFLMSLPMESKVISIAGRQTTGKGRGNNVWLSPEGCLMFSLPLRLHERGKLFSSTTLLQHITATAVVHAIRSQSGLQDLNVCIKWPNDVYYCRDIKIGGILTNCFSMGNQTTVVIGSGLNVCNQYPTLSLTDCILLHNKRHGTQLTCPSMELLLADILYFLEMLINDANARFAVGDSLFCKLYYQYWLHKTPHNVVTLESSGEEALITGIDDYGYLRVKIKGSDQVTELHPDGNSFDIMKGLIKAKK